MELFKYFKKKADETSRGRQLLLEEFCYKMAFSILPYMLFGDTERTIGLFTNSRYPPGEYVYLSACHVVSIKPRKEDVLRFQGFFGELSEKVTYYIVQYPEPLPFDSGAATSAVYFSAILRELTTGKVGYFVLSRSKNGLTTSVFMPGKDTLIRGGTKTVPELNAFLDSLRRLGFPIGEEIGRTADGRS